MNAISTYTDIEFVEWVSEYGGDDSLSNHLLFGDCLLDPAQGIRQKIRLRNCVRVSRCKCDDTFCEMVACNRISCRKMVHKKSPCFKDNANIWDIKGAARKGDNIDPDVSQRVGESVCQTYSWTVNVSVLTKHSYETFLDNKHLTLKE